MEINEETAASLGNKLAALDLSDEEGTLLAALLSPSDDDEVSGFGIDGPRADIKLKLGPPVLGPVEKNWSWGMSQRTTNWSWGISQD